MSTPALEVAGLNYRYPDGTEVLRDVGFHIHPGERVALLGPNGAGKTTLVLHLNGIIEPDSGTVRVAGLPVTPEHLMEIRRRDRGGVPGPRRSTIHADRMEGRRLWPGELRARGTMRWLPALWRRSMRSA